MRKDLINMAIQIIENNGAHNIQQNNDDNYAICANISWCDQCAANKDCYNALEHAPYINKKELEHIKENYPEHFI